MPTPLRWHGSAGTSHGDATTRTARDGGNRAGASSRHRKSEKPVGAVMAATPDGRGRSPTTLQPIHSDGGATMASSGTDLDHGPDMLSLGQSQQLARLHNVQDVFLMCPAVFSSIQGPSVR